MPKIILEDFDDMLAFEQKEQPTLVSAGIAEMDFDRMGRYLVIGLSCTKASGLTIPTIDQQD